MLPAELGEYPATEFASRDAMKMDVEMYGNSLSSRCFFLVVRSFLCFFDFLERLGLESDFGEWKRDLYRPF